MPIYNKLVRDLIPAIIQRNGGTPVTHIATPAEYAQALREKLREEIGEYLASGSVEELVDILEVVYALSAQAGMTTCRLNALRRQKARQRGGFSGGIILDRVIESGSEA